jgi:hypothetical protein
MISRLAVLLLPEAGRVVMAPPDTRNTSQHAAHDTLQPTCTTHSSTASITHYPQPVRPTPRSQPHHASTAEPSQHQAAHLQRAPEVRRQHLQVNILAEGLADVSLQEAHALAQLWLHEQPEEGPHDVHVGGRVHDEHAPAKYRRAGSKGSGRSWLQMPRSVRSGAEALMCAAGARRACARVQHPHACTWLAVAWPPKGRQARLQQAYTRRSPGLTSSCRACSPAAASGTCPRWASSPCACA